MPTKSKLRKPIVVEGLPSAVAIPLLTKRDRYLLKRFGITEAQYADMLLSQGGCCAICKRPAEIFKARLAVDHDHSTGHVRGLLCNFCNHRVVGRHRRDTIEAVYLYLTRDYPGWVVPPKIKKKKRKKRRKK